MSARARMRTASLAALATLAVGTAFMLTLCAPEARADESSAGTRAASFLASGVGPAPLGMAGANLALGRDLQGAAWNAAALAWIGGSQITLSHATFDDQTTQEWIGAGGAFGASAWRWGFAGRYRDEGAIEGRDASGNATGSVAANSIAGSFQLARRYGEHVAIGGAAHVVSERIADASGLGLAFDAGAQLRAGAFGVAIAGQDFGGGMNWSDGRWRMPATLGAGLAFEPLHGAVRFALDLRAPADAARSVRFGGEWRVRESLVVRAGYRRDLVSGTDADRLSGPSFGIGAGTGALWVDYGYLVDAGGTGTHRVGLSLRRLAALARAIAPATGPDASDAPIGPPAPPRE